jgi:tetratricopeptide (TPR) repeat protein
MQESSLKSSLTDLLDRTHDVQRALLAELGDAERNAIGTAERWSAKDMVAHITSWKRTTAERLAAAAHSESPPNVDDYEQLNAQTFEACRMRPWSEIIAESDQVHTDLLANVRSMSDADLADSSRFAWQNGRSLVSSVVGNGCWHPQLHLAQFYVERGDLPRANRIQQELTEAFRQFGDELMPRGTLLYNLACFYATTGQSDQALALLPEALRLQPDLVEWSREDTDLTSLHNLPAYQALYEA